MISSAAIDFDHVSHDYTTGTRVLSNVTFSVKGGQTVALVRLLAQWMTLLYLSGSNCGAILFKRMRGPIVITTFPRSASVSDPGQSSRSCWQIHNKTFFFVAKWRV